jgi:ATP-dependent Clp protease ATP-binding subunit ClpC
MPNIELKDILINARQESHRMQHYYIGVEHLFVALLEIQGGLARSLLEAQGLASEYVIDAVRRKIGKGSQRRLWAGAPFTPRASVVIGIAQDLASEDGREEINERDLLIALIEEADSIPLRVVRTLGVDFQRLAEMAHTHSLNNNAPQPYVHVDFSKSFTYTLNHDHLLILRRMFHNYSRIRLESRLTGGYTGALVLVVTPIHADLREDAAIVVKIDEQEMIMDEERRYETHIRGTLPPLTARLENRPVTPEGCNLAGLGYSIVTKHDQPPQDLRAAVSEIGVNRLGEWLREQLYAHFGRAWWRQRRAFRFQVWTEYDWLLPPVLTLNVAADYAASGSAHLLRVPVNRARIAPIVPGDIVTLENFTVQRTYPDRNALQVVSGRGSEATRRAYKIEITGRDPSSAGHYRGEVVERLVGQVWKTRRDWLMAAVESLEPPFDITAQAFALDAAGEHMLPNPIFAHEPLMQYYISGSTSKIHGDLHLGNILIGPGDSAFLIDFAQSREGHTLFDWATLEISLLSEIVMPAAGATWADAALVLDYIIALNAQAALPDLDAQITEAISPLTTVRDIVQELLAVEGNWAEYYIALALCALRAVTWDTMPQGARRLMFLVSALSMDDLRRRPPQTSEAQTPSPDETDYA